MESNVALFYTASPSSLNREIVQQVFFKEKGDRDKFIYFTESLLGKELSIKSAKVDAVFFSKEESSLIENFFIKNGLPKVNLKDFIKNMLPSEIIHSAGADNISIHSVTIFNEEIFKKIIESTKTHGIRILKPFAFNRSSFDLNNIPVADTFPAPLDGFNILRLNDLGYATLTKKIGISNRELL